MSTLTSSDFGELKRPTTRVHAPPGGGSSWGFGSPSPQKTQVQHSPQQNLSRSKLEEITPPSPTHAVRDLNLNENRPSTPVQQQIAQMQQTQSELSAHPRHRICVISLDSIQATACVEQCQVALQHQGILSTRVDAISVKNLLDLPFYALKAIEASTTDAVICIGVIPVSTSIDQSVIKSLLDISIKTSKLVMPAITLQSETTANTAQEIATRCLKMLDFAYQTQPKTNVAQQGATSLSPTKQKVSDVAELLKKNGNVFPHEIARAPSDVKKLLNELRLALANHGARGIVGLSRSFRSIDDDGSKAINLEEFHKSIKEHALHWSNKDVKLLFDYMDSDASGSIDYDEFLVALRGELNARRQQMALMAFQMIDDNNNGIIELDDIIKRYNADQHPEVISGKKTKNEVFREFLDTFDGGDKDGKVYPDEFVRYYSNVSASIDDDDYFELVIRNAWHISGGKGWCANTTCRRVLVTHADGHQSIEEIKNDLGIEAKDTNAMRANLDAQGVQAAEIGLTGTIDTRTPPSAPTPVIRRRGQTGAGPSSIIFG